MLSERQKEIMELLKNQKKVSVKELADRLFVSEATIRRNLIELKSLGLIERAHGAAILAEQSEEVSIFVRINKNAQEKEKAVSNILPHLPEFQSVFMDSSSTALALAERINLSHKTVVTNSLQTAVVLSKKEDINLILLGGSVQHNTVSATGSWSVRQLNDFSFDLMICSCAAVDGDAAMERTLEQKEIKRAAFMRSKKRMLIIDHFKFGGNGIHRIAALGDFDLVATDCPPPKEFLNQNVHFIYGE